MRLAELEIPARAEFVSLARLVISSIADDRYVLGDDQLDNLKLAVSEACVMVINAQAGRAREGSIFVECTGSARRIEVVVDSGAREGAIQKDEGQAEVEDLGLSLMRSLVDRIALEPHGSGARLRLTVDCEESDEL